MPRHLFVYGTLRRGSARPMALQLHRAATWLGPATANGALYDFGCFPGALFGEHLKGGVRGDLFIIPNNSRLLAALDAYEGIAGAAEGGLYRRVEIPVSPQNGGRLCAWSYALVEVPPASRRIPGGDWLKRPRRAR